MIMSKILDELLVDWFIKSFFPYIAKDVDLLRVTTKEQMIIRDQKLDLFYSQTQFIYDIFPNVLLSKMYPNKLKPRLHIDGVMSSIENTLND